MSKAKTHFIVLVLSTDYYDESPQACKSIARRSISTDPHKIDCKACLKYIAEHSDVARAQRDICDLQSEIDERQDDLDCLMEGLPEEVPK